MARKHRTVPRPPSRKRKTSARTVPPRPRGEAQRIAVRRLSAMKYRLAGATYRVIAEKLTEERAQAYADELAHLSHVRAQAPATACVAADVPAVRRGPGQGGRGNHRAKLPQGLFARTEENQDGLAGPALPDGQGGAAALPLAAGDRAVTIAARGIVSGPRVSTRGCTCAWRSWAGEIYDPPNR